MNILKSADRCVGRCWMMKKNVETGNVDTDFIFSDFDHNNT